MVPAVDHYFEDHYEPLHYQYLGQFWGGTENEPDEKDLQHIDARDKLTAAILGRWHDVGIKGVVCSFYRFQTLE